jgi:hypothetical protein
LGRGPSIHHLAVVFFFPLPVWGVGKFVSFRVEDYNGKKLKEA